MIKTILCVSLLTSWNVHPSVEVGTESVVTEEQDLFFFFSFLYWEIREGFIGSATDQVPARQVSSMLGGGGRTICLKRCLREQVRAVKVGGGHHHVLDKCVRDAVIKGGK